MKIAYVSTYPPFPCGIGEYTDFLIEKVSKHAEVDEIHVFTVFGNEYRQLGKITLIPSFERRSENLSFLLRSIKEVRPDVTHIQHEYSNFRADNSFLELLDELRNFTNVVVTLHNVIHSSSKIYKHQLEIIELSKAVFVHSPLCEYELWIQGADMKKVFLMPHGTHINQERAKREEISKIFHDININGEFILLIPGFLRWDKGIPFLEEALPEIFINFQDIIIIIAGSPQAEGEEYLLLKRVISKIEKEYQNVVFTKCYLPRKKLLALLSCCDAVLLPYREWRGHLGISGILHLAIGSLKPILASRIPRLMEYTTMFPELSFVEGDIEGFVKVLHTLRKNYDKFFELVKQNFSEFLKRTSWDVISKRHLEIYKSL